MPGPGFEWIGKEEEKEVLEVLRSRWMFRYGDEKDPAFKRKVKTLEEMVEKGFGTRHALAVTSGTAALITALSALGIGPGDEVIVPGYTFIASISSIVIARAVPVLAEVPEEWQGPVATGLYAVMREGEIFGLRKEDVDLAAGVIMVSRSWDAPRTKDGKAQPVPIADQLRPRLELALREAPGPLVFPKPDGSMHSRKLRLNRISGPPSLGPASSRATSTAAARRTAAGRSYGPPPGCRPHARSAGRRCSGPSPSRATSASTTPATPAARRW